MLCIDKAFEKYIDRLPPKPYHVNDFHCPKMISKKASALRSVYLQPNSLTHQYFMLFDVDRPTAVFDWSDRGLPSPHLIVKNPNNGHVHLTYILTKSIKSDFSGSYKAQKYCSDIELGLSLKLGADAAYNRVLTKTPAHVKWQTYSFESETYDLDYLCEFICKEKIAALKAELKATKSSHGVRRNCDLFEELRQFAYSERCKHVCYEAFYSRLESYAGAFNSSMYPHKPISFLELRGIVKSVARWTWKRFSLEVLNELKTKRARESGLKGGRPKTTTLEGKPWEMEGVSRATWYRKKELSTIIVA
ncbi:replication initiation protein [Pseudomonas libanensis]|uniref:replication initiation protein n=1 Tax=Pseudomonas libanensis TaxID=75588 RepID=UPI0009E91DDB|nr:replication initiation protein [Pseudomonas libanensis]